MLVAGQVACPTGHTRAYRGYLMTGPHGQQRNNFVCVDELPERIGTASDGPGPELWFTQVEGGAAAFGEYSAYSEVTCAVCTTGLGSTYQRYGATACPLEHTLIFTGQLGATSSAQQGGGS